MNALRLAHPRPTRRSSHRAVPWLLLAFACLTLRPAGAQTTFGTLSNFDVFNDTGQECHGFEIELDGLSSADVSYTFSYERYGSPTLVDISGGVIVRYMSGYANSTWQATTPMAPAVITPTAGHACWTGGDPNYLSKGCDHFGVAMNRNPTTTVYRWLVADLSNPGHLQPSGTKVSIPAPVWNVSVPPAGGNPVVQAVLPAEPPEVNRLYGDAQWVKVFVTEAPDPMELQHLVSSDPAVPDSQGETEVEWVLLQAGPNANNELVNERQAGANAQSVTRRYEFYAYTGAYDVETHEALPVSDSTPDPGDIGNYLGAQMAAVNLDPLAPTPTATPTVSPTVTTTPTPIHCVGDCSGDNHVTVDELVKGVDIALSTLPLTDCSAFDSNHDDKVTVDELVTAVNNALNGCAL